MNLLQTFYTARLKRIEQSTFKQCVCLLAALLVNWKIGCAIKHNQLLLGGLLFSRTDSMRAEEGIEVGAVDVDLASDLREGDEALVAVILPRLGGDAKEFAGCFGFYPFAAGVVGVAPGDEVDDLLQRGMEVAPFFFRHYEQQCRWGDILRCTLH